MIMVDSRSLERQHLFEEFFSPAKIILNHQRFDNLKSLSKWCLKILHQSIESKIAYEMLERKAFSSPSFSLVFENGLFIPHLKLEEISEFYSIFVVLTTFPLDLKTKREIRAVFTLFSPLSRDKFEKHLKILSLVSELFRDVQTLVRISELKTSDDIYKYLKTLI